MKCETKDCNNEARKGRKLCYKCLSRKWRKGKSSATYYLNMLRQSAARRGIKFSLTVDQFKDFCGRTGFLEKRGQGPNDMTIDREDPNGGYTIDNICMKTHRENSNLGARHRKNKNPF